MFQFIPVHEDNIYAVRVSGKLSHEDYQKFLPELEELIQTEKKIALLIELDDFHGVDISAIKDDLTFSLKHNDAFEKVSIVGEKKWHRWMTLLSTPFFKGAVRYFNRSDLQEAWDWLRIKNYSNDELADRRIENYKKVMACVDYSPHSKRALKRALKIAKDSDAELVLVNVVDESALYDLYYDPGGMGFVVTEFSQSSIEGSMTLIESLIDKSNTQMISLLSELGLNKDDGIVLTGRPNSTLDSYAKAQNVDLIVMGTHGRRGIDRVLGSSTRYVQSHARCEVLSVPLVNY